MAFWWIFLPLAVIFVVLLWVGYRFFLPSKPALLLAEVGADTPDLSLDIKPAVADVESTGLAAASLRPSGVNPLLWWLSALVLVIGLVIWSTLRLDAFHHLSFLLPSELRGQLHINAALTEARLEPPAPLPPEIFLAVASQRPGLMHASRDWSLLEPVFVQQVLQVMKKMEERGYPLALLEGYRSAERQDELAQLANVVTKAKGGQSKHQYGLAVDLAPVRNGKIVLSAKDEWAMQAYQALGEEAAAVGLTWGGNWSFKDYGHIEQTGSLAKLLQKNK